MFHIMQRRGKLQTNRTMCEATKVNIKIILKAHQMMDNYRIYESLWVSSIREINYGGLIC